eukprot:scaffold22697_cov67-Isochrysis_galbana.AAC.1
MRAASEGPKKYSHSVDEYALARPYAPPSSNDATRCEAGRQLRQALLPAQKQRGGAGGYATEGEQKLKAERAC